VEKADRLCLSQVINNVRVIGHVERMYPSYNVLRWHCFCGLLPPNPLLWSNHEKNIGKRTKLAWEIFESFVEESEGRAYCGRKAMDFR